MFLLISTGRSNRANGVANEILASERASKSCTHCYGRVKQILHKSVALSSAKKSLDGISMTQKNTLSQKKKKKKN